MIVCPNCGNENADDSAHCGFCGQQLTEGGKKTMFGMAALNVDQIQQAAEAAKAKAAEASGSQGGAPAFNLPKPNQGAAPGGAPTLNLGGQDDESAFAKTEMMPSVTAQSDAVPGPSTPQPAPQKDPFADEFAALEASYGNDPDFNAPVDPTPSGPQTPVSPGPSATTAPNPAAASGFGSPTTQPNPSMGPGSANPGFGAGPNNAGPGGFGTTPTGPGSTGPGPTGPSSFGAGPGGGAMQKAPNQSLEPKKNNNKIIIIAVVAFFASSLICGIIGAIVRVVMG